MTLKELQHNFHNQLDAIYDNNEVSGFFSLLLEHYLNLKPIELVLHPNFQVSNTDCDHFDVAINRLKQEEPIQYIIGKTEFFGLPIKVNQHTLIPRPETEELVQWIINDHKSIHKQQISILDIGTGSGCIAIALAKNLPNAKVYGLDVSEAALKVAKENAALNDVELNLIASDIFVSSSIKVDSESLKFDIIVSNPPYVREQEKSQIKKNVLEHEPHLALFVKNDDPLLFYRAISAFAVHNLKPKSVLFFEINQYLGAETKQLLSSFNFKSIELRKDINGNDRMLKAIKQ